jgi:hypothetical protein
MRDREFSDVHEFWICLIPLLRKDVGKKGAVA